MQSPQASSPLCQQTATPLAPQAEPSPFPSTINPSNPDEVEALFNRIAPFYDQLNSWLSLGQHSVWKQMAVNWSRPFSGATCLDICCGSGDLTRMLAHIAGPTGKVIGLDFATGQLEQAQKIAYLKLGSDHIQWIQGDALALPFPSKTFDAVTMGYGLRNVANMDQALAEIWRVLKPGRTAAILDFHRAYNEQIWTFQTWCLDHVVVPMANRFGMYDEYAYIRPSLERFPQGHHQVEIAQSVGFVQPVHYAIAGGMMGILVAHKP